MQEEPVSQAQMGERQSLMLVGVMRNSPTALRLLKSAMNAVEAEQSGLQQLGWDAIMLFYNSEEGNEVCFCCEDRDKHCRREQV